MDRRNMLRWHGTRHVVTSEQVVRERRDDESLMACKIRLENRSGLRLQQWEPLEGFTYDDEEYLGKWVDVPIIWEEPES